MIVAVVASSRVVDPVRAGVTAIEDEFQDPFGLFSPLCGKAHACLEFLEDDADDALDLGAHRRQHARTISAAARSNPPLRSDASNHGVNDVTPRL